MDAWNKLSFRERGKYIRKQYNNGNIGILKIRADYNKKFAEGGDLVEPQQKGGDVIDYGVPVRLAGVIDKTDSQPEKIDINNWLRARRNTGRYNDQIGGKEYNRQITNMYNSLELSPFQFHKEQLKKLNPKLSGNKLQKEAENYYTNSVVSGARGAYWKDNNTMYVENGANTASRKTHEFTHSLDAVPQEKKISSIVEIKDAYLDDPSEVYSRLMEFRMNNKLNPSKIYTEKDLDYLINSPNTKDSSDAPFLKRYDKKTILRLLNEVASNGSIKTNQSFT